MNSLILRSLISWLMILLFGVGSMCPSVYASNAFILPAVGSRLQVSPAVQASILKGLKINPNDPMQIEFVVDPGELNLSPDNLNEETLRMVKYFLAGLTLPEKDMWVNLSPYESNRIVADGVGETELGRDLLAQDYVLKQITASLTYPNEELGAKFWNSVYERAYAQYGTTDIPTSTFHKVWIVPDIAELYESDQGAYILDSSLKLMLEEDYLSMDWSRQTKVGGDSSEDESVQSMNITTEAMREYIIPVVTNEINQGEHFMALRQVYHALILATWFKDKMRQSLLTQVYANEHKTEGLNYIDIYSVDKIYTQYVAALKEGVFNLVKEEYNRQMDADLPKQYFSGGADMASLSDVIQVVQTLTEQMLTVMSDVAAAAIPFRFSIQLRKSNGRSDESSIRNQRVQNRNTVLKFLIRNPTSAKNMNITGVNGTSLTIQQLAAYVDSHPEADFRITSMNTAILRALSKPNSMTQLISATALVEMGPSVFARLQPKTGSTKFVHGGDGGHQFMRRLAARVLNDPDLSEQVMVTILDLMFRKLSIQVVEYPVEDRDSDAEKFMMLASAVTQFSTIRSIPSSLPVDSAQATSPVGGIDLEDIDLAVKNQGEMSDFQFDPLLIAEIKADLNGLVPVIIDVAPIQNLPQYLGIAQSTGGNPSGNDLSIL